MREQKYKYIIETGKGLVIEFYTLDEIEKGKVNVLNHSAPRKIIARLESTGLKDKNGVEIYEGDLLKIEMDWGYGLAEIIIKVYFENGSFRAKALNSHEDTLLLELPYLEVIGNIYETPELLESK